MDKHKYELTYSCKEAQIISGMRCFNSYLPLNFIYSNSREMPHVLKNQRYFNTIIHARNISSDLYFLIAYRRSRGRWRAMKNNCETLSRTNHLKHMPKRQNRKEGVTPQTDEQ